MPCIFQSHKNWSKNPSIYSPIYLSLPRSDLAIYFSCLPCPYRSLFVSGAALRGASADGAVAGDQLLEVRPSEHGHSRRLPIERASARPHYTPECQVRHTR